MNVLFHDPDTVVLNGMYNHCRLRGVNSSFATSLPESGNYDIVVSTDPSTEPLNSRCIVIKPTKWDAAVNADDGYSRDFLTTFCGIDTTSCPYGRYETAVTCAFSESRLVHSHTSLVDFRIGAGGSGPRTEFPCVFTISGPVSRRIEDEIVSKLASGVSTMKDKYSGVLHVVASVTLDGDLFVYRLYSGCWHPIMIPFYELFPSDCVTTVLNIESNEPQHNYAFAMALRAGPSCIGKTLALTDKSLKHSWPVALSQEPPYTILDDVVGYCTSNGRTVEECKRRVFRNINLSYRLSQNLLSDELMYRADVFRGAGVMNDILVKAGIIDDPVAVYTE